jgi:hypothetical protein
LVEGGEVKGREDNEVERSPIRIKIEDRSRKLIFESKLRSPSEVREKKKRESRFSVTLLNSTREKRRGHDTKGRSEAT